MAGDWGSNTGYEGQSSHFGQGSHERADPGMKRVCRASSCSYNGKGLAGFQGPVGGRRMHRCWTSCFAGGLTSSKFIRSISHLIHVRVTLLRHQST